MKKNFHILVIDDDPLVRELLTDYLESLGYILSTASGGEEGIHKISATEPDMVLLDLCMPDKDGLSVLKELNGYVMEHPVVVISALDDIRFAVEALHLGAWDYLVKPFNDFSILNHTIEIAFERAELIRENKKYQEKLELLVEERTREIRKKQKELEKMNQKLKQEILEKERIQRELEILNQELEVRVKERTYQLEQVNRELKQSLEKLSQDEEAGRKIQLKSLPRKDISWESYHFDYIYFPSLYLSGDFLDIFEIDMNHIGFYVADVSGHGVSSALITMLLKSLMGHYVHRYHSFGDETLMQPHKLVERINEHIIQADLGKYLEIFYGIIQNRDNCMLYTNAGFYPFPMLISETMEQFLELKQPPVGLYPDEQFTACEIELPEQFLLLIASDGIFEIMKNRRLMEKEEEIRHIGRLLYTNSRSLNQIIYMNQNSELNDDVTILIIERRLSL